MKRERERIDRMRRDKREIVSQGVNWTNVQFKMFRALTIVWGEYKQGSTLSNVFGKVIL